MKNFWKNKNVMVTGSEGFIGSWLCKELTKRQANLIPIKKQTDFVTLTAFMKLYKPDIIFHLGAQSQVGKAIQNPAETFSKNIQGTWDILQAAMLTNIRRIIIASTDHVYGEGFLRKETDSLNAISPYDVSKVAVDKIAQSYLSTYNMNIVITRFCNVYGGGDLNFNRIVPDTIITILRKKQLFIRSDGRAVREYIYIKDVVDAYLILAESDETGAFNIGSEVVLDVLTLVSAIICNMKKFKLKPKVLNQAKNETQNQSLNSDKFYKTFSWKPRYTMQEGLKETIRWYKNEKNKSWK